MSSCCGSVCLLVLLGVALACGSPLHLPEDLIHLQESIADLLALKEPEIGSKPLFSSVIKSVDTSCQRKEDILLMNATLDVYMHIFSSILQHGHRHHDGTVTSALLKNLPGSERSRVNSALTKLQQKMGELRRRLGQPNHNKQDMLSELNKIKVDDPIDQRKALAEFQQVYRTASLIGSHS
ncbi:interferon gamma 1 [Xiphias gladius]|uniref:interferon gamma 1 n=1 Tax=Xiphias gladius TaxID=8245 RepID=UPI001A98EE1E|nr:interferon gamma 1 [Xiphias gladius]